ncbi:MAG: hypothetical protein OXF88_00245 [Rhodobacteraceae bacterium]|nr:hypothetical protein [Paracoccaceae bacterium]
MSACKLPRTWRLSRNASSAWVGEIERLPPGKAENAVVVRIVLSFLELDKGGGDVDQRPLSLLAV